MPRIGVDASSGLSVGLSRWQCLLRALVENGKGFMKRYCILGLFAAAALVGCGTSKSGSSTDGSLTMDGPPPATVDTHDHASEGPHHGSLVELGKEEYHAEVVHTQDSVTVYILDKQAKNAVPIDATEVMINIVHDGKPEQFKLAAAPEASDGAGKSSKFILTDAELASHIDDSAAAPKLSLSIAGKSYRGDIKHSHDHSHDHPH